MENIPHSFPPKPGSSRDVYSREFFAEDLYERFMRSSLDGKITDIAEALVGVGATESETYAMIDAINLCRDERGDPEIYARILDYFRYITRDMTGEEARGRIIDGNYDL